MAKIKIKQTKSQIGSTARQKATLKALGLRKMQQVVEHKDSPVIQGMVAKVGHLVTIL